MDLRCFDTSGLSSVIGEVVYDPVRRHLDVELKSGYRYRYFDIPSAVFDAFEKEADAQRRESASNRWHDKGNKPYSVGTFWADRLEHRFGQTRLTFNWELRRWG